MYETTKTLPPSLASKTNYLALLGVIGTYVLCDIAEARFQAAMYVHQCDHVLRDVCAALAPPEVSVPRLH